MELFGVIGAMPAAFCASALYSQVLVRLALTGSLRRFVLGVSVALLAALVVEWVLLAKLGAVGCRSVIGPAFYPLHLVLFFLAVPSLANILVLGRAVPVVWPVVGLLSGAFALPVVLTQYGVSEALYGIGR